MRSSLLITNENGVMSLKHSGCALAPACFAAEAFQPILTDHTQPRVRYFAWIGDR